MSTPHNHCAASLGGGDIELGNFILGREADADTSTEAAQAILAEIDGIASTAPVASTGSGNSSGGYCSGGYRAMHDSYRSNPDGGDSSAANDGFNPQDWCRKFLPCNGGSIYIDMTHTESALPEIRSGYDYVKYYHAMLRIVRAGQAAANQKLLEKTAGRERIQVLVNNSDGRGSSYGAHTNIRISRRTFDDIASRKMHYLMFLASYQVSSIIFTGQGKVGSENGRPKVDFQITQRGDFFSAVCGTQTTFNRPVVNLRDESHCGRCNNRWARLHVIFYDAPLAHGSAWLKFSVLQLVLAMIAAGRVNIDLILDDPIKALTLWGHDISLTRRAAMMTGAELTAIELQFRFLEEARRFVDAGACNLANADQILAFWQDTLTKLKAGDLDSLTPRLDWVLKLSLIRQALRRRPELNWESPQIKCLDLLYSSLDPAEGLYWAVERAGGTERIVPESEIEQATTEPPSDTRAFTRAMLLRRAGHLIDSMDWDHIRFTQNRILEMPDPAAMTRQDAQSLLTQDRTLTEIINELNLLSGDPAMVAGRR